MRIAAPATNSPTPAPVWRPPSRSTCTALAASLQLAFLQKLCPTQSSSVHRRRVLRPTVKLSTDSAPSSDSPFARSKHVLNQPTPVSTPNSVFTNASSAMTTRIPTRLAVLTPISMFPSYHRPHLHRRHMRNMPQPMRARDRSEKTPPGTSRIATRHRGNRPRLDHQKQRPPIQKAPQRPQRLPQVDILPARLRHHRRQFAIAQRPNDRHRRRQQPSRNQQRRRPQYPAHIRRTIKIPTRSSTPSQSRSPKTTPSPAQNAGSTHQQPCHPEPKAKDLLFAMGAQRFQDSRSLQPTASAPESLPPPRPPSSHPQTAHSPPPPNPPPPQSHSGSSPA